MSDIDYVLGLLAGEGCFSVGIEYSDSYKFGVATRWLFRFEMCDREMVQHVNGVMGLNADIGSRTRENDEQKIYHIYCRNSNEITHIIEWVRTHSTEQFKRSDKHDAFTEWADLWNDRDRLMKSRDGTVKLIRRANEINADRRGKDVDEVVDHIRRRVLE